MRLGLNVNINVKDINKSKLLEHENGKTYLSLTTFIDTASEDRYGNHGFVTQSQTKEEREEGVKLPILGNCKVFWSDDGGQPRQPRQQKQVEDSVDFDDSIPF